MSGPSELQDLSSTAAADPEGPVAPTSEVPAHQRLADLLASAAFAVQPQGYEPARVDRFVEDLADRCTGGRSPADLRQRVAAARFPVWERGYSPAEVDAFIDRIVTEVDALEAGEPDAAAEVPDAEPAPSGPRSSAVFKALPTTPAEDHLMTTAQPEQPIPFRIVLRG